MAKKRKLICPTASRLYGIILLRLILIYLSSHSPAVECADPTVKSNYSTISKASVSSPLNNNKVISLAAVSNATKGDLLSNKEIDQLIESESSIQQNYGDDKSHRIVANGWPNTSPMWPSVEMADNANGETPGVQPFIYADKPHASDYSLLLDLNDTLIEMLKTGPTGDSNGSGTTSVAVTLSFEYYFNFAPNATALPGIRIEVDRKQFKYLEPSLDFDKGNTKRSLTQVRARMWIGFNERLQVVDGQQFDKHDWLKFSLINRQSPSLVAIRKLRVEFKLDNGSQQDSPSSSPPTGTKPELEQATTPAPAPPLLQSPADNLPPPPPPPYTTPNRAPVAPQAPPVQPQQPQQPTYVDDSQVNDWQQQQQQPQAQPQPPSQFDQRLAPPPTGPQVPRPEQQPPLSDNDLGNGPGNNYGPADGSISDQVPAASNQALTSTIKPVDPKKKGGWNPFGRKRRRRRKRQAGLAPGSNDKTNVIVLECYRADACSHWKSDTSGPSSATSGGQIQWSLARMPPSTQRVKNGYFYASNRQNYGDANKVFRLSLNQTDLATESDKRADHCIQLAVYVTERARLLLHKYTRSHMDVSSGDEEAQWIKGPLLLEWSPTLSGSEPAKSAATNTTIRSRLSPNSRIRASEDDQAGWTLDRLCFGDFFTNSSTRSDLCGSGECAFGFQMGLADHPEAAGAPGHGSSDDNSVSVDLSRHEQVVGVALVHDHSTNDAFRWPVGGNKWLQTWQRREVNPQDHWRFYPNMDYEFNPSNVTLLNLYNDATYFIESEWLSNGEHLDFRANLLIEKLRAADSNLNDTQAGINKSSREAVNLFKEDSFIENREEPLFSLHAVTSLVDADYNQIYSINSTLEWPPIIMLPDLHHSTSSHTNSSNAATTTQKYDKDNLSLLYNLSLQLSDHLNDWHHAHEDKLKSDLMFKIVIQLKLSISSLIMDQQVTPKSDASSLFHITVANVSLSDRCFPSPCEHGDCKQNGTSPNDWECNCDQRYRGRRCEFARWCQLIHVTLPTVSTSNLSPLPVGSQQQQIKSVTSSGGSQQQVIVQSSSPDNVFRITGREFCARKLGHGSECSELDLALNDETYTDEGITFRCSCKDDFYLSDDGKCKQAHQCNSIVCPLNQFCDDSRPFNQTEPCRCNERLDWHKDALSNKCVRKQCLDKQKDCGFAAHVCLPTLPGERPICKCHEKFALKTNEKGQKYCESTACVLPTLNDCEHICEPLSNSTDLERPYRCNCHPGYVLAADGRSCRPSSSRAPHCKPQCHADTQICTEHGCRCKQGYVPEGEVIVKRQPGSASGHSSTSAQMDYIQSVRCLNKCTLSYAENKDEFERIESVCPLGLCDKKTFECSCFDRKSSALVNTKYEPIYEQPIHHDNDAAANGTHHNDHSGRKRKSPLCHLKRVCEPNKSKGYRKCRERGAICVPDYTKASMFDCVCPPATEKRHLAGGSSELDFTCEPRCSSIKSECLLKQAICRLVDKDAVKCECLPGFIFDTHDHKCYLAKYSYSINLVLVNKYYEPESRFHRLEAPATNHSDPSVEQSNNSEVLDQPLSELANPAAQVAPTDIAAARKSNWKSVFIAEYNQCNLTQVIPKAIIEDPYETDMETYLEYIEQCNEKLHESARMSHLNSRLSEDIRQALRQHLNEFTVTTNQSLCDEIPNSNGMFLNCTIFLQSQEPISKDLVEGVFNVCDKKGADSQYCWIKPRLLLRRMQLGSSGDSHSNSTNQQKVDLNFKQVVPCELNKFCGEEAESVRLDETSSLCSCKCPTDIELNDIKVLYPRAKSAGNTGNGCGSNLILNPRFSSITSDQQQYPIAYKEICAPRDHCGLNSTYCASKAGSKCHYDLRAGSRCLCVYPAYEDSTTGACVEVVFGPIEDTLIVVIVLLGVTLLVSIALNLYALMRSRTSFFGHSKQYPLSEFRSAGESSQQQQQQHNGHHRPHIGAPQPTNRMSRSTGVPNLSFTHDDE